MPWDVEVSMRGGRQWRDDLHRAAAELQDFSQEHDAIGRDLVKHARRRAPKLTGALAAGVSADTGKQHTLVTLGRQPYGPPIHNGWRRRNIRPQPFMFQARDARRRNAAKTVARRVRAIVRRAN